MSRVAVIAVVTALLVPAIAAERAGAAVHCRTVLLNAQLHKTCTGKKHEKKAKKKKVAAPKPIRVTTTLLDGSALTTPAGTFGIGGTIAGRIPGKVTRNAATTVTERSAALTVAPGSPCGAVTLAPTPALYVAPSGFMVLNADGTVFAKLVLDLPACGGQTLLLLAGKVGPLGLNGLVLDSIPGPATAHLVVKVDLSGG